MNSPRVLVTWVGATDLKLMADTLPDPERRRTYEVLGLQGEYEALAEPSTQRKGPTCTLLAKESFDEIHLFNNYASWLGDRYRDWVGGDARIHNLHIESPTDYTSIYRAVNGTLAEILPADSDRRPELCIHLSPGTPAMTAIWLLLGKSRYPARFFQTHQGKAWETEVPFDLRVDFLPELYRQPDLGLVHLAMRRPGEIEGFEGIIGSSPAMRVAVGRASRAALRSVNVLLLGESGTGKELFARAIHAAGSRAGKPFVAINCAAVPASLLESELFGAVKGAFTDAVDRRGAFSQADGGTLFLDEVGECSLEMQAKLLRVLQPSPGEPATSREFRRVGSEHPESADVRIIAATNRDPHRAMADGEFRVDLYYRLATVTMKLPRLRDRREDIPLLADQFLDEINAEFEREEPGYRPRTLSTDAARYLTEYTWPGNARELRSVLVQAAVMAAGDVLQRGDIAAAVADLGERGEVLFSERALGSGFSLDEYLAEIQRHYLRRAMEEAGGVKKRAAELLGIRNYQTLDNRLKRFGVDE